MTRRRSSSILIGFSLVAALLFPGPSPRAEGVSLHDLTDSLRIDKSAISVSGLSSGAYMAQQFHVIHSSRVKGAGIVAGGPFNCAGGSYLGSWFDLYAALHVCSATNLFGLFFGPPDVAQSIGFTRQEAEAGRIDDPANLQDARVWLFSGGNDEKIPRSVVESVESYYSEFLGSDGIKFDSNSLANHAMITDDFGNPCAADGSPYINDCDFDAAMALLQHIHGLDPPMPKAPEADLQPIITFDQTEFFDQTDKSVSLHALGYLYVPARCAEGETCRLHVAFHGCRQDQDEIRDAFYSGAGYNEVAETNDTVVLYPQTTAWSESFFFAYLENPRACWDWWGYSGDDYFRRSGKQIRAVAQMINALLGEDLLRLE